MTLYNSFIEELPLILFTVIAQSAVGFSIIYALNNGAVASEDKSYKKFGIIFTGFVIIGMIISIFHLGDPLHAPYMITRVLGFAQNGSYVISWLPLEIVGLSIMVVLGLLILLKGTRVAINILPIIGITMLLAMSNIYGSMAETVPTWNLKLTVLLFFSSALLLGSIAYAAFIAKKDNEYKVSKIATALGFILFVLALILYTFYIGNLRLDTITNIFNVTQGNYVALLSWGIILCGISLILVFLENNKEQAFLSKFAFVIALVGVFLTRILFYGLITSHMFLG